MNQEQSPHPTPWHLDLTLSASRNVRIKFLLLISFPISRILLQKLKGTETLPVTFFTPSSLVQTVNNQGPLSHTIHHHFVLFLLISLKIYS